MNVSPIEEMIRAVRQGDIDRYAEIVRRYQQEIFIYCCHLLMHREEAEDAAQDVFLKAFEKIHLYTYDRSFSAWLYKIAYNHCLNLLRQRKRNRLLQWFARRKAEESREDDRLSAVEGVNEPLLSRSLMRMTPAERSLIILRILHEKSYEEIGIVLDGSPAALRKKFERAKNKLRTIWNQLEGENYENTRGVRTAAEPTIIER